MLRRLQTSFAFSRFARSAAAAKFHQWHQARRICSSSPPSVDPRDVACELIRNPNFLKDVTYLLDHHPDLQKEFEASTSSKKSADGSSKEGIRFAQWLKLCARSFFLFGGAGVVGAALMISIGEFVDVNFGVTHGFSTLLSCGIGLAGADLLRTLWYPIARSFSDRVVFLDPRFTARQAALPSVLWIRTLFHSLGVACGCLAALLPVILYDRGNNPRLQDVLYSGIPLEIRRELSHHATRCAFNPGQVLFKFGEDADAIYAITRGTVRQIGRTNDGHVGDMCTRSAGSSVGMMEVLFLHKCPADSIALTNVTALRISAADFQRITAKVDIRKIVREAIESDASLCPPSRLGICCPKKQRWAVPPSSF